MLKLLIAGLKVDVNQANRAGWTPIHFAAQRKDENLLRILVEKFGAKVDAKTYGLWTPLHLIFDLPQKKEERNQKEKERNEEEEKDENLVRYLYSNGADLAAQTEEGWTPLHVAVRQGNLEGVKALLECFSEEKQKLERQQKRNSEEKKDLVNLRNEDGWSPLCIALQAASASKAKNDDCLDLIRLLLENGADPEYFHISSRNFILERQKQREAMKKQMKEKQRLERKQKEKEQEKAKVKQQKKGEKKETKTRKEKQRERRRNQRKKKARRS